MSHQTEYITLRKFSIGSPPIDIPAGVTVIFDDYTLTLAGRPPVPLPQLRGAITAGWLISAADYEPGMQAPRPPSAGISIRPADGGNPMEIKPRTMVTVAQEEEREVGNIQAHAQQVRNVNNKVYATNVEPQDGVEVRHIGSPNKKNDWVQIDGSNADRMIREASAKTIQPGVGRTREQVMAEMSPAQRAQYEQEIAARKAAHGILDSKVAVPSGHQVVAGPETQGKVLVNLSVPKSSSREGIQTSNSVGGGIETVDLGGTGGPLETRKVTREGLTFTETNGPRRDGPTPARVETDPRRIIAKTLCADFPDIYDFEAPARKKIARIQADFENRPDIIRAVAAAETDSEMKTRLVQEFPEAFGG